MADKIFITGNGVENAIFEMADATNENEYFTIGLWHTLAEAIAALNSCTTDDIDSIPAFDADQDALKLEIYQRKVGWGGCGKCVFTREYEKNYPDDGNDEYVWKIKEKES